MNKATELPRRKSTHLRDYDYANPGYYFVTICTRDKQCLFGDVVNDVMQLNEAGLIVDACWHGIANHFPIVILDQHVVMPNHVHGIIRLCEIVRARHASPLREVAASLGTVIGSFKSAASKQLRSQPGMAGVPIWQRNYYEHVIRSDASLQAIREYIINNPKQWALDRENPKFSNR
jgi:REP element-mobilizing transposase RayT